MPEEIKNKDADMLKGIGVSILFARRQIKCLIKITFQNNNHL